MTLYVALTYTADVDWTAPEHAEEMKDYAAFGQAAAAVIRGGHALYPTATATTVRVQGGDVLTSDGPYAETKEALTGFYLLECADLRRPFDGDGPARPAAAAPAGRARAAVLLRHVHRADRPRPGLQRRHGEEPVRPRPGNAARPPGPGGLLGIFCHTPLRRFRHVLRRARDRNARPGHPRLDP
ncbi:hypothetical protein GCM10010170_110480 [Dactylosporangium salmoneum]|uniref:YCII-related domain-containing protein n=1 Tax=Dactylosporangium salmoneum TaxID=53361 RepID=A0ABN3I5Z1_9ACTN